MTFTVASNSFKPGDTTALASARASATIALRFWLNLKPMTSGGVHAPQD